MRFRSTWTRSAFILAPLLLAGCRITEDMPTGEKIALGVIQGVGILALAMLMVVLMALASVR